MTLDPKAMQKQAEMEAEALRRAMASVANAPKMEVRKHRPHRAGSEGGGYTAQLWLDGKHAADLSNSGDGGCDRFYWRDDAARARFTDFVKAMPEVPVFGMNLPAARSTVCAFAPSIARASSTGRSGTWFIGSLRGAGGRG
jgi:hypothetical protein